ncbi:MAG TPA: PEP-CTERM sorting domain-containing protein [Acetobacteraceae bacterium]|nr:PEP-CTERM sorting domain-containing protein [Acetobacteraceae bacterium]
MACATAAAALGGWMTPARATFIIDPNPGGAQFFINGANKNVSTFTGDSSGSSVTVKTAGHVDTGNGFANISPVKNGTLTDLIFTPDDPTLFSDFSFRGQLERAGFTGTVDVNVTDQFGTVSSLVFNGLAGPNADFARIGVVSLDGETIKSVEILTPGSETFKEVKQIEFSASGLPVPEPASVALLGIGLLGLGIAHRRKNSKTSS